MACVYYSAGVQVFCICIFYESLLDMDSVILLQVLTAFQNQKVHEL